MANVRIKLEQKFSTMNLHHTQEKLLEMLTNNVSTPLSIRQLQDLLDLSSPSLVYHHITQLEKKGYLKRNPSNPADYQVLTTPEEPITFLNLYGSGKCGPDGLLLSGNPISRIPIASSLISFPIDQAFLIKADGDSMEPEIKNDDLVIARKHNSPEEGEIVVCSLNSDVKIKKLRRLSDTEIILESINNKYSPILVKEDMAFRIEGVVRGLIRR
ncbi:MAG: S24 family peptidase [Candidatus Cloacimonetes bacterium]|nr:S24 family peptidase [Candidatus Cloacimonadota bacterium]MDD3972193.1 S24 family peptidase [Clostridia bacterium]